MPIAPFEWEGDLVLFRTWIHLPHLLQVGRGSTLNPLRREPSVLESLYHLEWRSDACSDVLTLRKERGSCRCLMHIEARCMGWSAMRRVAKRAGLAPYRFFALDDW